MRVESEAITAWCDGSWEEEEGERVARWAYVILRGRDELAAGAGEVGRGREMTANVAEYAAVLRALEALVALGLAGGAVRVCSDSRVVMHQAGMLGAVRSLRLLPWWQAVRAVARGFAEVHWEWVPRERNREADECLRRLRVGRDAISPPIGEGEDETPQAAL